MRLPVVGPTYENDSRDINYQRCINMFVTAVGEQAGAKGRTYAALTRTRGKKELVDLGSQQVRAIINYRNTMYAVGDQTVYKLDINEDNETATATSVGSISSTEGIVHWAINPTQVMMVDGTTEGYILTPSTDTVATITDTDFTGGDSVVFIGSYFVYNTPDAATMYATAINDGTDISALDVATAEALPDNLVAVSNDKFELWAFGANSIEVWFIDPNNIAFPFDRRGGAFIDQGCAAKNSIVKFNNTLTWLDDRGFIVQGISYQPKVISTDAIAADIQTYERIDDAYAWEERDRGHVFYVITFPSAKRTWAYDAMTQLWHERAYWSENDEFEHDLPQVVTAYKNWDLAGSRRDGKIYLLKRDVYTDNGETIRCLRTTGHQADEFKMVTVHDLELHLETGKGLVTGQGSDPLITLRYSNDGGYTWSHEMTRSLGKIGNYDTMVRWNRLGTAREWTFEFVLSDPIAFNIIDASVNISEG